MQKIAAITFHHAHNFGSVLQAYALQEYVKGLFKEEKIEVEYQIIDYYTEKQQEFYSIFKPGLNVKAIVKNLIAFPHKRDLEVKYQKFESFLSEMCSMTKRYKSAEELFDGQLCADFYISGSDQLWNVRAMDFSDVYYLGFVKKGKKISYAASFGPLKINWDLYQPEKYKKLLNEYSSISVREQGSAENVQFLTGRECSVNIDPTLLLSADKSKSIQSTANYRDGRYILLYCLEPSREQLLMAEAISKKLELPILILRYNNKNDMFNPFIKRYDSGPKDFLAYLDHAELVLSSSFHGTAFSLLYHKPFYVFNGSKDHRILSILKRVGMEERLIESMPEVQKISLKQPDGLEIDRVLEEERQRSRKYLKSALEIEI